MLDTMSSTQFAEWVEYHNLEPFGAQRADMRLAPLVSMYANVNRDPEKTSEFSPYDFIPNGGELEREAAAQSAWSGGDVLRMWAMQVNAVHSAREKKRSD